MYVYIEYILNILQNIQKLPKNIFAKIWFKIYLRKKIFYQYIFLSFFK